MATYILSFGLFSVSFSCFLCHLLFAYHSSSATLFALKCHLHCCPHYASVIRDSLLQTCLKQLTVMNIFHSIKPISFPFEAGKKRQFCPKPCFSSIEDTAKVSALVKAHGRPPATSSVTTIKFKPNKTEVPKST